MKTIERNNAERKGSQIHLNERVSWNHDMGIWIDGQFSWSSSGKHEVFLEENRIASNLYDKSSFLSDSSYLYNYTIKNDKPTSRKIKMFFYNRGADVCNNQQNHTTFYTPAEHFMLHYVSDTYILVNGNYDGKGISQYTTGVLNDERFNRFCHEQGILSFQPLARGDVYSIFSIEGWLSPYEETSFHYWVTSATVKEGAVSANNYIESSLDMFTL